ncbi:MAG: hypothetical protein JOZ83_02225 [Silvibacterium sp.]|nr:hypothetical protein [Silvibacterium sp.]
MKALKEWQRITRPGGALVLVLPYYTQTFDHRRTPTPTRHMLEDFERNVGEDDMTHLDEILAKHDLDRDPYAGTPEQFRLRSLSNKDNRCFHHHVFDEHNSRDLLLAIGIKVLALERAHPFHLFLVARFP